TLNFELYPDLRQSGGLAAALQAALQEFKTDLIVQLPCGSFASARVRRGHSSSRLILAAHQRAFNVDFWNQGVLYGAGWFNNLKDAARSIVVFNVQLASLEEMTKSFALFEARDNAYAHERGSEAFAAHAWRSIEHRLNIENENGIRLAGELLPIVIEASHRPRLRQLFPFLSLYGLCFSRTTGYPYTRDCPVAHGTGSGHFRVEHGYRTYRW